MPTGCCIISCHPLIALPFCPLIALAGCCVASPYTTLLSSCCVSHLPLAITLLLSITNAIKHHQMLLPPSNATTTTTIECHLYCPPLPQLPSIATIKCQHPPLFIATVKG
jgi:hypothetical protein